MSRIREHLHRKTFNLPLYDDDNELLEDAADLEDKLDESEGKVGELTEEIESLEQDYDNLVAKVEEFKTLIPEELEDEYKKLFKYMERY